MKPAWDKLSGDYATSSHVVVADVDCTVETDLCSTHGVKGYPTIKYFKDGSKEGESYSGGRDYDSLSKWTAENLDVQCDVETPEGCTAKELKYITTAKTKGDEWIDKQVIRLNGMTSRSMKASLKEWLHQRLRILNQLKAAESVKEEL